MMPKAELENYRIMRALPLTVNRLGLKMIHELNAEHLTRILENALQVSHDQIIILINVLIIFGLDQDSFGLTKSP